MENASHLDQTDPLAHFREQFLFPQHNGRDMIYFCGHSLGLQPKQTAAYVQQAMDAWANLGVEGHFNGEHPWVPYHEEVTQGLAHLTGARPEEVIAMNSLTVNLHLLMVSFYRPQGQRTKILVEPDLFPSDRYAFESQLRYHGLDPAEHLVELKYRAGERTLRADDILQQIAEHGDSLALILLGGVNYLSGQYFDLPAITEAGHRCGALVGFDLAHTVGNLPLQLHDWNVDFAVWCNYKYLNAGPGGIAAAFIHQRHLADKTLPRFEGWWGHNKTTRFLMPKAFDPILSAEAWQLSNAPILQLAALRASLDIFLQTTSTDLRKKSKKLTGYLVECLKPLGHLLEVITPSDPAQRGSQLSLRLHPDLIDPVKQLRKHGVIVDFREPDILRVAPMALYNQFSEVEAFANILKQLLEQHENA